MKNFELIWKKQYNEAIMQMMFLPVLHLNTFLSIDRHEFPNVLVCRKILDQAGKCILSQSRNFKFNKIS